MPSTVASSRPEFTVPDEPALPPVETAYSTELLYGQVKLAGTLKVPDELVVCVLSNVGAEPLPVVPAA
jgi:hypothetical protein